jgi:N-acetylated-alpha-linked acidic dipeptidase
MFRRLLSTLCLASFSLASLPVLAEPLPLLGFSPTSAAQERTLEGQFDAQLDRGHLRDWMQRLSAKPHHIGSPGDKENAEFIAAQFRSWGYETEIERFDVLFPTPKSRVLELTGARKYRARLAEPPLKEDGTSAVPGQLPIYNAYSIDGEVTAPLVYVNYGVPKDYEVLAEHGIDVKGKIVIARYGGSWRGIKPKVAYEHGAIGCIIYSDPKDDGFGQGEIYPKGPWRSPYGAQRGSVADMPVHPGDPLTPGIGSVPGAKRLEMKAAETLTKIPVLPISYADALPLLQALEGPIAPPEWRGALPLTYRLGASTAAVHLKLVFDWLQTPVYDVIAKLPGKERPDEWIIRGNHHDAWVFGANDPLSGAVALMEEARAVSTLTKTGWKPKRTIVYALWSGEEPGLLGSTEWVETHAQLLQQKAALYINSDSNARGFLDIGGSHSLEKFANQVTADVTDPETGLSVGARSRAYEIVKGSAEERREARERSDLRIGALGSGSDFTPFLQHLGIASLNLGFGGEGVGGSYHSTYDSFDNYVRFLDPKFDYGIALTQTAGRLTLRAADADVLPFEFTDFADTLQTYVSEVTKLAKTLREETAEKNRQIIEKLLVAVADPTQTYVTPQTKVPVPEFNFAPLEQALTRLKSSAKLYDASKATTLSPQQQLALDGLLSQIEQKMTQEAGLPRRPWFKHQIYAPGFYTGYGVKTLPAIREAIEQRQWSEVQTQIPIVASTLDQVSDQIEKATALLGATR